MFRLFVCVFAAYTISFCLCSCEVDAQPTQNGTSDDAALQALTEGVNIFSFKFFLEALKAKKGQNSIMSPFSAMIPMAQLGLAAENETKNQLLASLNLANKDQIRQAFPLLLDALKGSDGITFNKALRIYVSDDYPLLEEYIIESNKTFNATPENVNCRDSAGTANKINKWVEANTNNRIKDLISPDVINDLTRLILVNAIYFKGTWKKQFNVNDTKEQDFYTYDKRIVPVQMMFIETILEYANDAILNAQIVRLTYTKEEYSMVIVLPNDRDGFDKTTASLNATNMKAALGKLYKTKVKVFLPRMEINADFELIPILQKLGIINIFDAGKSDIRNILKKFEPLYVTAAKQKAFFQCNEQGTEAAAATAIVGGATSSIDPPPEKPTVRCDHPFLFIIYIKKYPVFIGANLIDK